MPDTKPFPYPFVTVSEARAMLTDCAKADALSAAVAARKPWQIDRLRDAADALPSMSLHAERLVSTCRVMVDALLRLGHHGQHQDMEECDACEAVLMWWHGEKPTPIDFSKSGLPFERTGPVGF